MPEGQEMKAMPDCYFPEYNLGRTSVALGLEMATRMRVKQSVLFWQEEIKSGFSGGT